MHNVSAITFASNIQLMKTNIEIIIDGLKKAAVELEKFQVQATLGKAEAKDKYAEARKKFNANLQDVKRIAKDKYKDLKPLVESLQVQFTLGKAETKEVLKEQRKKFSKAIAGLEAYFKKEKVK